MPHVARWLACSHLEHVEGETRLSGRLQWLKPFRDIVQNGSGPNPHASTERGRPAFEVPWRKDAKDAPVSSMGHEIQGVWHNLRTHYTAST